MLHEVLQHTIRASTLPAVQLSATTGGQPGEQQFHPLAEETDISFPEHSLYSDAPARRRYSSSTRVGGDHQALNDRSEQPPSFSEPKPSGSETLRYPEPGEPPRDSGLDVPLRFPQPIMLTPEPPSGEQISIITIQESLNNELKPIIPADVKRYERNIKMKWVEPKRLVITPQDRARFMEDEPVQNGWCAFIHPEGPKVYYHPEKRIFTDADMRLGKVDSQTLLTKADALMTYAMRSPVSTRFDGGVETVLEVSVGSRYTIESCGYYFVDHSTRTIFWAHPYTCEPDGEILYNVKSAKRHSHIRYSLEAQYWHHCELYPYPKLPLRPTFEELKEIIIHANAETVTSDTYLAPFDANELAKMLDIMDRIEGSIDKMNAHSVCVIARFMRIFAKVKFMNFCGQPGVRVDADRSIYVRQRHKRETLIFRLSNLILWYAPQKQYRRIQRVWVDEIINAPRWKNFITQQNYEWTGFTLYSTVMLAVDVSFLAVPNVINDHSDSAPNLAVYMSALCSAGSLVVSVLLVGQSQDYNLQTAEGGATYMSLMTSAITGVENLAVMYSLPFALLIWAMAFFGLALSMFIFRTSSTTTLATMGPGWSIVMMFTLWPVMTHLMIWLPDLVAILIRQPRRVVGYLLGSGRSEQAFETGV